MTIALIIGGAQKSGTTSVRRVLASHPGVAAQVVDELGGLAEPGARLGTDTFEREWFEPGPGVRVAKLAGLMYRPDAIERVHRAYPDAVHLLVLRDPVARAHSAFWHMRRTGLETAPDLRTALDLGVERFPPDDRRRLLCDYVRLSRYDLAVADLLTTVPRGQLEVVELEALRRSLVPLHPVLERVGLDPAELADELPRDNPATKPRSQAMARATSAGTVRRLAARALPRPLRRRAAIALRQANQQPFDVPTLEDDVRTRLTAELGEVAERSSAVLGRPIGESWARPPTGAPG